MISAPVANVDKIELLTVTSNNYDVVFMTCNLGSFTSRLLQHKFRGGVGHSVVFSAMPVCARTFILSSPEINRYDIPGNAVWGDQNTVHAFVARDHLKLIRGTVG